MRQNKQKEELRSEKSSRKHLDVYDARIHNITMQEITVEKKVGKKH